MTTELSPHSESASESLSSETESLRIVGIAASAGGLEAISLLVQNLPDDVNAAYVIAQHMSPTHNSVLPLLISRETKLRVQELTQEMVVEPDTIYVTPPNSDVVYENGFLRLRQPSGHAASPKPLADRLFKSMAEHAGERCVGIVLSGTGSDGSYGVQAIREEGGITIAQDPESAKYDAMPQSAIGTGCVDLTLPPDKIGLHLEKILARPRNLGALQALIEQPSRLGELFGILQARTQVDFGDYKENMLNRRIARRMSALGIEDYDAYVSYCRTNVDEVDSLHRDFLISVTRFFRDPKQFAQLRIEMVHALANRPDGPIRIWVVGCATGEEAYSIAIMIAEIMGGLSTLSKSRLQIFATDIDSNAIETARRGVYPISAAQDIPEEYLHEYFTIGDSDITVRPELRAVTLFSRHNAFQDPPFINVDLVSIRNLLIYFNLALQERVLTRLHYSMVRGGLLFIGTSESVGEMSVYFEAREGSDKIFSKRRGIGSDLAGVTSHRSMSGAAGSYPRVEKSTKPQADNVVFAELSIAKAIAPNGMICAHDGSILEVIGELSPFLEIRAGVPTSLNIKMLMDPLRAEAVSLIAVALRSKERKDGRWHTVSLPIGNRVQIQAFPFHAHRGGEMICLVAINTKFEKDLSPQINMDGNEDQVAYIRRMENEIRSTQEALQQTIEQLQTTNEELQSANEELQSTNEEFQATNEELETSNEELQSTNEELLTVNEELQITSAERQALASELEASLVASPYVFALADQALMVRRMSKAGLEFFGISDVPPTGIHMSQFNLPPGFPAFAPIGNIVLRLHEERKISVVSEGKYFDLVFSPVLDVHGKLVGVSISVTHFDAEPMNKILNLMSTSQHISYWTYNIETDAFYGSPELFTMLGLDPSGTPMTIQDFQSLVFEEDRETVSKATRKMIQFGGHAEGERRLRHADGHLIRAYSHAASFQDSDGRTNQLIGVLHDVSSEIENEILLTNCQDAISDLNIGFFSLDFTSEKVTWNAGLYDIFQLDPSRPAPGFDAGLEMIHPEHREMVASEIETARLNGGKFQYEAKIIRADGVEVWCEGRGAFRRRPSGEVTHLFGSFRQIDGPSVIKH